MEEEIKKLELKILALTNEIQDMKELQRKSQRDYTQNKVFTSRITFRNKATNFPNLPTSSTDLSVGDIYNDTGFVKIKE